jgi:elongation factor G
MEVRPLQPALMKLRLEQGEAICPERLHESFEHALREGHWVSACFTPAANRACMAKLVDVFPAPPAQQESMAAQHTSRSDTALP